MCFTQETKNGNTVNVRYCLYDNGSKTDADGNSCEELVLEKVYPDGNYETELVDIYLVNTDTMQVTDEQKKVMRTQDIKYVEMKRRRRRREAQVSFISRSTQR